MLCLQFQSTFAVFQRNASLVNHGIAVGLASTSGPGLARKIILCVPSWGWDFHKESSSQWIRTSASEKWHTVCVINAHFSLVTGDLDDIIPHRRNGLYPCYGELLLCFTRKSFILFMPAGSSKTWGSHCSWWLPFSCNSGGILAHVS